MRTCGPGDCGPEPSAAWRPRGLFSLQATTSPGEAGWGEEGVVAGGVCDQRPPAEDGPVTWEALASPRHLPVRRRAGDPSPTHDTEAGTRVVGPRGPDQASAAREATARGTGAVADGGRESAGCRRAVTSGNGLASGTRPSQGGPCCGALSEGTLPDAQTGEARSPGLFKGGARAQRAPAGRVHSLAHVIDVPAVARASHRPRAAAAVGVDGGTQETSGQHLEANLQDLPARLKPKRYRQQPRRRVPIPKARGKTRPIGLAACEDQVVQDALRAVLEALYEQDLLDCSHGFRPARHAHDAVRPLQRRGERGEARWLSAAALVSCCDRWERHTRKERRGMRVAEGSLRRRLGTGVHVGGLDGDAVGEPA